MRPTLLALTMIGILSCAAIPVSHPYVPGSRDIPSNQAYMLPATRIDIDLIVSTVRYSAGRYTAVAETLGLPSRRPSAEKQLRMRVRREKPKRLGSPSPIALLSSRIET